MTQSEKPKDGANAQRERLDIRAQMPPIARINRKILIGAIALGLLVLAGIVIVAFNPPRLTPERGKELINTTAKQTPDALARLPASYDRLPKPASAFDPPVKADTQVRSELPGGDLSPERAGNEEARTSPVFFRLVHTPPLAKSKDGLNTSNAAPTGTAQVDSGGPRTSPTFATRSASQRPTEVPRPNGHNAITVGALTASDSTASRQTLRRPRSPYTLMAGTIISASLLTGLNSDLPGFVVAQTTEHVYDTVTGRHLLIPQGTRLIGNYETRIAFGQNRALVVWQRIIRPDGSSIEIDNLPATDAGGYTGLTDQVDRKTLALLKGIALATVFGVGAELVLGQNDNNLVTALRRATQTTTNTAGDKLIGRGLDVKPTLTVRPGWPLRVIVHKDLVLSPYVTTANH